MSYYICKGKINRYTTIGKPIYNRDHFTDYFDYFVGYTKTPDELNVSFPFPQEFTDINGRIWLLEEGKKPDNHQFLRKKEINWQNQTYYKTRNPEKYQDPHPKWVACDTPGLWKNLKQKGLLNA